MTCAATWGPVIIAPWRAATAHDRGGEELGAWELATIAFLLLAFSAVSRRFERSVVTAAIFFTSAGLLAGPVLGLIDLRIGGEPVKLLAEATLTLVLFADASRISFPALRSEFAVPARLLGVGLPLTIAAGTLVGVGVLPGVSLVEALVLSIMLACTDAALGQTVVTDERIPSRIRQGLNVESGLNDGICVPLFFIALGIAEAHEGTTTAHAAAHLVLEELGYGLIGGIVAGVLGAFALRVATRHSLVEPHWLQILTAATAVLAVGIAIGLGGSMIDESSLPHERTLLLAVVATIGISVFAHGLSARPLTNRYVSWYASHPREKLPPMESVPAATHRWRKPRAAALEPASQRATKNDQ